MPLNRAQRLQVEKQLAEHRHTRYSTDIRLSDTRALEGFLVCPDVMRPERMTSLSLAGYLYENPDLYERKTVLDMGCGCGLQGIVMALGGAENVYFTDISSGAFGNTLENVDKFHPQAAVVILRGDLFERIACSFDLIVFNHPFFAGSPKEKEAVAVSMLDPGKLIQRFLKEAKGHLLERGMIIMPFLHIAGTTNDPSIQGVKQGYNVSVLMEAEQLDGLQKGEISIYGLSLP